MISRLLLSALLISAGTIHLVMPELFNPAIPFSQKLLVNYFAGILEIILGVGLWLPHWRDLSARTTALWFLLLTPIHVYVSLNEIPIFGISHPAFLWMRTLLQAILYFWALSLQKKNWIISQRWRDVLFLHYEVDPIELQKRVPYPLDLYQGKAVVSVVPFLMGRIRFPFLPSLPGLSRLVELNLRTYVTIENRPAVYFFTLDSNHLPGVLVARLGFALPYRWKKMRLLRNEHYEFYSEDLTLKAKIGEEFKANDFHTWATERYALVTRRWGQDLVGVVEHEPWKLKTAEIVSLNDNFTKLLGPGLKVGPSLGVSFAESLDVRFRPFSKSDRQKF